MPKPKGLPEDLVTFFQGAGGHSLLIKGPAGTGKTTLALQMIEELGEVGSSYYLTVRVSDESLYHQFPWLREKLHRSDVVQVGKGFLRTVKANPQAGGKHGEAKEAVKTARKLLRSVTGDEVRVEKVDRTELNKLEGRVEMGQEGDEVYDKVGEGEVVDNSIIFDLGSDLPELDMAYDVVESNLPKKSLLVIDSIDALSERYGIHPSKLVNTLQKDLVENSNTNIAYVLESSGENRLDYLGDGVIQLQSAEFEGRRLRVLKVDKLRGTEIGQHKYVFTLRDGRVKAFTSREAEVPSKPKPWEPIADLAKDVLSTGHPDLDLLVGGLPRGRVAAIEVGVNVPSRFVDNLLTGLMANFTTQGRGVAFVPPRKANADVVREVLDPYVGATAFQETIALFEVTSGSVAEAGVRSIQLEGTSIENDLRWPTVEYHLSKAKDPYLSLVAFDTLESVYPGQDIVGGLTGHLAALRRSRGVFVGITAPHNRSTPALANLATVHLRIGNVDGCMVLYGEKPYTGLHNLSFDVTAGFPRAILTPIV